MKVGAEDEKADVFVIEETTVVAGRIKMKFVFERFFERVEGVAVYVFPIDIVNGPCNNERNSRWTEDAKNYDARRRIAGCINIGAWKPKYWLILLNNIYVI